MGDGRQWSYKFYTFIFFAVPFRWYLSNLIDCTLIRRRAVAQSAFFFYFILAWSTRYFVNVFICLIIPRAPTVTGTLGVLRRYIFSIFIYLFYCILWLICYYLLVPSYQLEDIFFFHCPWPLYRIYYSIFLPVLTAKSQRISVSFASVNGSGWGVYRFSQCNIP